MDGACLIKNGQVFDGHRCHDDAVILISAGRIEKIFHRGEQLPDNVGEIDVDRRLIAPGLIDLQVNGGGGVLFNAQPTVAGLKTIALAHRRFGTTSLLPTLISCDDRTMQRGMEAVDAALASRVPGIAGIHLEGPFLSTAYSGVHDRAQVRKVNAGLLQRLPELPAGRVLMTVAPEEVPSGTVRRLVERGVIVFAGHSGASYEQVAAAIEAGVSGFTHLFNAMTPFGSREPGVVGAALDSEETYCGIIADGFHVHPASLRVAIAAKQPGKMILVTDAMPTVGSEDDTFMLDGREIHAAGGRCLTPDGALAGTHIGLIDAVRNTAEFGGVDIPEALRMASAYPAAALGLDDQLGYIRAGYRANLIEIDESFEVTRSWIDGDVLDHREQAAWT